MLGLHLSDRCWQIMLYPVRRVGATFEWGPRRFLLLLFSAPTLYSRGGTKSLSSMAMDMLMRRMGRIETVYGFRSAFSDWVSEQTSFSSETREQCLAHQISDRAQAAYRRGDQLEKRRKLLEA